MRNVCVMHRPFLHEKQCDTTHVMVALHSSHGNKEVCQQSHTWAMLLWRSQVCLKSLRTFHNRCLEIIQLVQFHILLKAKLDRTGIPGFT